MVYYVPPSYLVMSILYTHFIPIIHHNLQLMISHDRTQGSLLTSFTFILIIHMEENARTKFEGRIYLLLTCFSVFTCLYMSMFSSGHMSELGALFVICFISILFDTEMTSCLLCIYSNTSSTTHWQIFVEQLV